MNIDWEKIKKDYPEACNKISKELKLYQYTIDSSCDNCNVLCHGGIKKHKECQKTLEDICYCDLEEFFDNFGIIIFIYYYIEERFIKYFYKIIISDNNYTIINNNTFLNRTKDKAKEQAIYKAFEILNDMIKKGEVK